MVSITKIDLYGERQKSPNEFKHKNILHLMFELLRIHYLCRETSEEHSRTILTSEFYLIWIIH